MKGPIQGNIVTGKPRSRSGKNSFHLTKEKTLSALNEVFVPLPLSDEMELGSAGSNPI